MTANPGELLRAALRLAEASDATALIIQLASEGAVLRSIRPLAVEVAEAEVPVVVYVAPSGTASGAAGAFLLSAAHIAAMAPDTSFGTPAPLAEVDAVLSEQTRELVLASVADQLRGWNEDRGRSTAWIDQAVREGVIRTNNQAFATEPPAVDLVARDIEELLVLLEGRTVELANGNEVQLNTLGRTPDLIEPNVWEQFLLLLANPTVAFLLIVMGGVAIYAELVTPGIGIAAGLGAVLLLGALVGFIVLPIRIVSLAGLILAFTLITTDLYTPTHGTLTVIGLVLLVVSAMTLIDTAQAPNVFIALWAIVVVVMVIGAFVAAGIWLVMRIRHQPVTTGREGMIGRLAEVRQRLDPDGMVFVDGALWRAISDNGAVELGEWVRIRAIHELRLVVSPLEPVEPEEADRGA
ncbi:MAG: nodulation protein NfeD [Chloroflexaceae bacterium]|nr:nodulation protein NfeD [Chloroflexaceae bacterium]